MANGKYYVTTAIPYVNGKPHIGFALEVVQADVLARWQRLLGQKEVFFLTGTDENALKNVQAAKAAGKPTGEYVGENAQKFKELKSLLSLSFDDFIRTTEKRHFLGAQKLWQKCNKDIYQKDYKGNYCLGCEEFKTEKDLVEGRCPEHPDKELEAVAERNYFFALSKYQEKIESLIESEEIKIVPEIRKNEVLAFVKRGLEDFSISRSKERAENWGIPVPGDEGQIIYVWFDALINYLTALGYAEDGDLFKKFWPADVQIIGKGISRFHAVYWPAMLLSAGLPLPKTIFIHGYITAEGQKMSKSLGNVIDPADLVGQYGAEAVRYYLLREIPAWGDGDFSKSRFEQLYQADLANGLGNLVQRVAKLCENNGISLDNSLFREKNKPLREGKFDRLLKKIQPEMEKFLFNWALEKIWGEIEERNKYLSKKKPWLLDPEKDQAKIVSTVTLSIINLLEIAEALEPFLPETAKRIKEIFSATKIRAPEKPLFPRLG